MTTDFTLPTKTRIDSFKDIASIEDAVSYRFGCTPWQEDNAAITSVTWVVEYGGASISNEALASGIVSALVTFSQSGKVLISILLNTATTKKKLWLEIFVKDKPQYINDDYGLSA